MKMSRTLFMIIFNTATKNAFILPKRGVLRFKQAAILFNCGSRRRWVWKASGNKIIRSLPKAIYTFDGVFFPSFCHPHAGINQWTRHWKLWNIFHYESNLWWRNHIKNGQKCYQIWKVKVVYFISSHNWYLNWCFYEVMICFIDKQSSDGSCLPTTNTIEIINEKIR